MAEEYKNEDWLREKYWDEGKSQAEIAEELGVSHRTVGRWMKKHNMEIRSKSERHSEGNSGKLRDEEWLRREYKNKQKSQTEIAEELGVSRRTVSNWMDKHGIETRSRSESQSEGNAEKLWNGEWLREQYKNKQRSQAEIAEELGVSRRTVGRWMKKHNIEPRSKSERHSEGDVGKLKNEEWVREQYQNQGRSTVDIADELEVGSNTVRRWMEKHGIEVRSASDIQSRRNVEELRDGEWIREQYENQQKTTYEIADELDVSPYTVSRWMEKHGIEARSISETHSEGNIEKLWNGEWLREQYQNQKKSCDEIADKLNVSSTTVRDWLERHRISIRSSIINPEYTTHIVRSEWELEMCNILIEEGVDYSYESIEVEYCDGSTYIPDFVTDEYVIEIKGAYFSEIHNHENTEREKALATMESLDERDYVVVGQELPADIHISWEERSKIRELFSNTQAEPTASQSDCHSTP